jgi:hypothetical protein
MGEGFTSGYGNSCRRVVLPDFIDDGNRILLLHHMIRFSPVITNVTTRAGKIVFGGNRQIDHGKPVMLSDLETLSEPPGWLCRGYV